MTNNNRFDTASIDLATLFLYALPAGSHLSTVYARGRLKFTFEGFDECRTLSSELRGTEPLAVGDLKAFCAAGEALRSTIRVARCNGRWERDSEEATNV